MMGSTLTKRWVGPSPCGRWQSMKVLGFSLVEVLPGHRGMISPPFIEIMMMMMMVMMAVMVIRMRMMMEILIMLMVIMMTTKIMIMTVITIMTIMNI